MTLDCWGCRHAPARFCSACVHQAISARHALLREFSADKHRLETAMAQGIEARAATLRQRVARRAHGVTMTRLEAELAATRHETDRLAQQVNALRHSIRRSQLRAAPQPSTDEEASSSAAASASTAAAAAGVDRRLTAARRRLVRELYHLHRDVWSTDATARASAAAGSSAAAGASSSPPSMSSGGVSPTSGAARAAAACVTSDADARPLAHGIAPGLPLATE